MDRKDTAIVVLLILLLLLVAGITVGPLGQSGEECHPGDPPGDRDERPSPE